MAGFAAMIAPGSAPQEMEVEFQHFLQLAAQCKQLEAPTTKASGRNCFAAKLDSPATIHPGLILDHQTGSWLLAAGTVVALEGENYPITILRTLLQDFIRNGTKALEGYDGHFALVIYNGIDESLSVLSDPIGFFSIFYGQRGGRVFLSSSALAIARQIQSPPDILAAEHFLRAGRLDGGKTLWQDVKRLTGGKILKVVNGRVEENFYWMPTRDPVITGLSMEEALEQSHATLTKIFSRLLDREGNIWVDLTGGFDSRLSAMFIAKQNRPFITYCTGPDDSQDVQISKKISSVMQWEYVNTQLPEEWGSDQFEIFSTIPGCGDGRANLLRFAMTRRGFDERSSTSLVNIMGVGGENLRGFRWQVERDKIGKTTKVNYPALLNSLFAETMHLEVMRQDRSRDVRQEMLRHIQQLLSPYADSPNSTQIDRLEIDRDANHGGAYLSSLTAVQRSLGPLCFKAQVNFAFSLKYQWKLPRTHLFVRSLMERENPRLASIETTTGGPAYPVRVTNAHHFWPLWRTMANRAAAIGSKKLFGKALQPWPSPAEGGYPLPSWRKAFHDYARSEGMLSYETMCSKGLYQPNTFAALVMNDDPAAHPHDEFLDRVISIEMCLRATGASIDE
jgi:hypothetical protein